MMFHIIYKITNILNGKFYYGVHSTENIDDGYMGSGKILKIAISKYGIENFKKEIICFFDERNEALLYEKSIVTEELLKNPLCYNAVLGGGSPPTRTGKISPSTLLTGDQRTEKQKKAAEKHSQRMKNKSPWNKGLKGKQIGWNKNKKHINGNKHTKLTHICPHCGKQGNGNSMKRWHFDNCKTKK